MSITKEHHEKKSADQRARTQAPPLQADPWSATPATDLLGGLTPAPPAYTERSMLDRLNVRYGKTYTNGAYKGRQYSRAEHVQNSVSPQWTTGRIADHIALDAFSCGHKDLTDAEKQTVHEGGGYNFAQAAAGAIHGREVKVSRADWLSELADPSRADAWKRYCTYWWLVAPRDVVRDDLTDGWGLLVPHGPSLRIEVGPKRLDPEPMPVRTSVALARAITKTETRLALEAANV